MSRDGPDDARASTPRRPATMSGVQATGALAPDHDEIETLITPDRALKTTWSDLVAYRELFYFLVWRDIKIRYKQTAIGATWAVLQPLAMMVTFTLIFNRIAHISSEGVPYAVFSYTGLIYWSFFTAALNSASNSLLANQAMVTKVYFPRIIAPVASTMVALVDFAVAFAIGGVLLAAYRIVPGLLGIALVLPMLAIAFCTSAGTGIFLAALNVRYRDVKYVLPFLTQLLMFLTPVIYPVSAVPSRLQWLLYLNPMTAVVTDMRAGLLHQGEIRWGLTALSAGISVVLLLAGTWWFDRHNASFADVL